MFCSFLCYNAQNDIQILLARIDKFFWLPKHWLPLSFKSFVCTYLSCTSLLSFMELFSKITFFSASRRNSLLFRSRKRVQNYRVYSKPPNFSAGNFQKIFSPEARKPLMRLILNALRHTKNFSPAAHFFVPTKAQGPLPCRDANANLDLS